MPRSTVGRAGGAGAEPPRFFVVPDCRGSVAYSGTVGSWVPVEPSWVAPEIAQVADLMWLAYGSWARSGSQRSAAVMATAAWVRGGRPAPVTERADAPVTRALAEAELWATFEVTMPPCPSESMCAGLGVGYRPPVVLDHVWAVGVAATLRWLLGMSEPPPMALPQRRSDGSVASADELYELALRARPWWESSAGGAAGPAVAVRDRRQPRAAAR